MRERRLTVTDRAPESGDVLEMTYGDGTIVFTAYGDNPFYSSRIGDLRVDMEIRDLEEARCRYVKRQDGGPLSIPRLVTKQ